MEWVATLVGPLGIGLCTGGFIGILGRRKRRKLAAAGDENARSQLEKWRTLETVVAPMLVAAGVCLLAVQFYLDYRKALTPLPPEKALERAMERMKSLPKN